MNALGKAASKRGLWSSDESRRGVELLTLEEYETLDYLERRLEGMRRILREKGDPRPVRSADAQGAPPPAPRYQAGDPVRVRADEPATFHRTPGYVKGQIGRITRWVGAFPNPESLGHGGDGLPLVTLYSVRFRMADLWPEAGASGDTLTVDLYEHWLEPSEEGPES